MKVSVIIPTYEGEKCIRKAIQTVRSQQQEIQIILVDDCSSDNTVNIARNMGIDPIVLGNNSGGPNTPRNMGLDLIDGDWYCFLCRFMIYYLPFFAPFLRFTPNVLPLRPVLFVLWPRTFLEPNECLTPL